MAQENLKFTKEHEWIKISSEKGVIGITDYAQHELGDVVYVELPSAGKAFNKGEPCANIESVKAVSDVFAPVSGSVVMVNGKLSEHPELLNQDPYGEGWLFEVKITKPEEIKELLDKNQYEEYLKGISGE